MLSVLVDKLCLDRMRGVAVEFNSLCFFCLLVQRFIGENNSLRAFVVCSWVCFAWT